MYTYRTAVKLHDTDAAGVLFFANYFRLAHEAYEAWMSAVGFDFFHLIHEADYLVLIVRAECDFRRPLRVGDGVTVRMTASGIGRSSFTLAYTVVDDDDRVVAQGATVHACVGKPGLNSVPLPAGLKTELEKLQ